jgi:Tol biopolymer transport system component
VTSCGVLSDVEPAWAPSGRALLFTRQRAYGAVSSVYRVDADGRHLRRLTPLGEYAYGGAWSADGTRVAYTTFDLAAVARIVVARADGTGAQVLASFQGVRYPPATFVTWSATGELAYVDFDGDLRTPTRLLARGATQPAWSPDGTRIAYVGARGITVADADGRNARVIADGGEPAWSPAGTRIAYTAAPGVGVHVISADGSGDELVDAKATRPRWTPAFAAEPQFSSSELRIVRLDGRNERRLTYHCVRLDESAGTAIYGTWLPDVIDARNRFRDTVSCGAGHDVVYADRRDHVGRRCEVVHRR